MRYRKYLAVISIISVGIFMSCRDESLYPLPYNDRTTGAYLRMYSVATNVLDLNNFANSAFETDFEAVDAEYGDLLQSIEFYITYRASTAPGGITNEVFLKSVPADGLFQDVPQPTYSLYKRGVVRITHAEMNTALLTTAVQGPNEFWPSLARKANYTTMVTGDQVVLRWQIVLKNGQRFSVLNPQGNNSSENNSTANITGGQYYSSPFQFTMTVRSLVTTSFTGNYSLEQISIWSPNHGVDLHLAAYPTTLNEELFPDQNVSLSIPSNGLSTQREFDVQYRGITSKLKINFEQADPLTGQTAANVSAIVSTLGLGAARPRGTIYVQLQDSQADCSSNRGLYWTNPGTGIFGSTARGNNPAGSPAAGVDPAIPALPAGLPQGVMPNRGLYYSDATGGTATGEVFYIAVDDDSDEYGRRNGYCSWTRRVYLRLTKL